MLVSLATDYQDETFGTVQNATEDAAKHIINEQTGYHAVIPEGHSTVLAWSESAFPGTLITLNWNNGSGKMGKIAAFGDNTTSFSISAPSNPHYKCTGWYLENGTLLIKPDGGLAAGVESYTDASGKWIHTENRLSLTAGWEQTETELTLNGNGGTPGSQTVIVPKGSSTVTFTAPTKTGCEFTGWYLEDSTLLIKLDGKLVISDATAEYVATDGKWKYNQTTLTLNAGWEQIGTELTLNGNGGTPGSQTVIVPKGSSKVTFTAPTKTNYEFAGWYLENGTMLIRPDGTLIGGVESYTDDSGKWQYNQTTLTLYAGWGGHHYNLPRQDK